MLEKHIKKERFISNDNSLIWLGTDKTTRSGAGLVLHKRAGYALISHNAISKSHLAIRLRHCHERFFVVVYAPTNDADPDVKDLFYTDLM